MEAYKLLLTIALFTALPFSTYGAGLDCTKANTETEKLICSDAELTALDTQMNEAYQSAKNTILQDKTKQDDAIQSFNEYHQKWLKERNNTAPKKENLIYIKKLAIKQSYQDHIDDLTLISIITPSYSDFKAEQAVPLLSKTGSPDTLLHLLPIIDNSVLEEISCYMFKYHPQKATETFGGYFGGRLDGRIPLCSESIEDKVPEIKLLIEKLEPISGRFCGGTVTYLFHRNSKLSLTKAAIVPYYDDVNILAEFPSRQSVTPERLLQVLDMWKDQGEWEQQYYKNLLSETETAYNALLAYYRTTLKDRSDIKENGESVAAHYLQEIILSYVGILGPQKTLSYPSQAFNLQDVDSYLKTGVIPARDFYYADHANLSKPLQLRRLMGLAIIAGYKDTDIQRFITDGADLNSSLNDSTIDTPLMMASSKGAVSQMRILLIAGGNPNLQNAFGKTALMYAIQSGKAQAVQILIQNKADVNLATYSLERMESSICNQLSAGLRTPLMYAVWQGTPDMVKMLVDAGATIKAKDDQEKTALDYLEKSSLNENDKQTIRGILK